MAGKQVISVPLTSCVMLGKLLGLSLHPISSSAEWGSWKHSFPGVVMWIYQVNACKSTQRARDNVMEGPRVELMLWLDFPDADSEMRTRVQGISSRKSSQLVVEEGDTSRRSSYQARVQFQLKPHRGILYRLCHKVVLTMRGSECSGTHSSLLENAKQPQQPKSSSSKSRCRRGLLVVEAHLSWEGVCRNGKIDLQGFGWSFHSISLR